MTVNTGRGTGTLHLDLVNGTGITNTGGTPLAGLPVTGETYRSTRAARSSAAAKASWSTGFGNGGYALFGDVRIRDGAGTHSRARGRPDPGGRRHRMRRQSSIRTIRMQRYCTLQLAQYSASGAPDASFGTNGRVVTAVTNIGPEVNFIRQQRRHVLRERRPLQRDQRRAVRGQVHERRCARPVVRDERRRHAEFVAARDGIIGSASTTSGRVVIRGHDA